MLDPPKLVRSPAATFWGAHATPRGKVGGDDRTRSLPSLHFKVQSKSFKQFLDTSTSNRNTSKTLQKHFNRFQNTSTVFKTLQPFSKHFKRQTRLKSKDRFKRKKFFASLECFAVLPVNKNGKGEEQAASWERSSGPCADEVHQAGPTNPTRQGS